jgi:hypothetical protein
MLTTCYKYSEAGNGDRYAEKMKDRTQRERQEARQGKDDEPGSETERFRIIVECRHNEAVTGESGVPRHQREHELRRQRRSLEEFS